MNEIVLNKREVDEKLKQDESRLAELRESLEKSEQLTGNMVTILDSFTTRLKKLDETILPVYNQTLRLTRLQENVEKTLQQLDRVIGFHHVADEVEPKVREGPVAGIEAYLKLLEKLHVAVEFFTQNNPGSVELSHVNELFETGLEMLQKEFLQLLKRHSKPVPVPILHDIAACEDMEDLPLLEHLPVRTVLDLKAIAQYLMSPGGNTDIMSVYAQIRSNQLGRSLNSLKEASQQAQLLPASIPKKSSFAAAFLKGHGPSPIKRATKRESVRRGEPGPRLGSSASFLGEPTLAGPVEDQLEGCSAFMSSATVFLRLIQSEVRLMEQIIPPQHHKHVLDSLTKQPIEFFMREGEALFQQARRGIIRHDFSITISCLRVIKIIQTLQPEYRGVLQGLPSDSFSRFPLLIEQFEKLGLKALDDYTQYIRGDPEKQSNLPKDGTVHELTSNTMWFIEQLLDYTRIVGDMFLGQSSFGRRSTDLERKKALGQYLVRVLDALNINLDNKARCYENPFLSAVFLMNNYHFIHRAFTGNEIMLKQLTEVFQDIEDHYNSLIGNQGRAYQRGFLKLISFLGQEASMTVAAEKVGKQSRQVLKDKFKGFNTELEELHRMQQQWSIPDAQLRARIREDNVEMITPLYTEFYRQFSKANFTKNHEKYVKYTPESLEDTLRAFFDSGAS